MHELLVCYCSLYINCSVRTSDVCCACGNFQSQTIKMMYAIIAETIRDTGLDTQVKPTDYLNFYCLGNRETKKPGEAAPLNPPEPKSRHVS